VNIDTYVANWHDLLDSIEHEFIRKGVEPNSNKIRFDAFF